MQLVTQGRPSWMTVNIVLEGKSLLLKNNINSYPVFWELIKMLNDRFENHNSVPCEFSTTFQTHLNGPFNGRKEVFGASM